jgi:hypothetical protein
MGFLRDGINRINEKLYLGLVTNGWSFRSVHSADAAEVTGREV